MRTRGKGKSSTIDAHSRNRKNVANGHALGAQNIPREIVMLVGDGCKWRKCRFCDYHLDSSLDIEANYKINKEALEQVTGLYNELEVINSGSFVDLDEKTISLIKKICLEKNIKTIHFECHYMHKDDVKDFKKSFEDLGVESIIKLGLETFDYNLRENVLVKGIEEKGPKYKDNKRVDILLNNTDFGVGENKEQIQLRKKKTNQFFTVKNQLQIRKR